MITVKYFASLRERTGRAEDQIEIGASATVADVWARLHGGENLPRHVLVAVNLEYSSAEQAVHDGDEVAFFPPVTGG